MGYRAKRAGLIAGGIIGSGILYVLFQMYLPFPNGLYLGTLVWIAISGVCIGIAFTVIKSTNEKGKSPLAIINERYAKGEITKEEFEKMKKDFENS